MRMLQLNHQPIFRWFQLSPDVMRHPIRFRPFLELPSKSLNLGPKLMLCVKLLIWGYRVWGTAGRTFVVIIHNLMKERKVLAHPYWKNHIYMVYICVYILLSINWLSFWIVLFLFHAFSISLDFFRSQNCNCSVHVHIFNLFCSFYKFRSLTLKFVFEILNNFVISLV